MLRFSFVSNVIKQADKEQEFGLTAYEYAFYPAVADNDSAMDLMQKDKLRELAVVYLSGWNKMLLLTGT